MNDSPLLSLFKAAVEAVKGGPAVQRQWQQTPIEGEFYLIAVGKAAQAMAEGVRELAGAQIIKGLVLSKYEHIDADYAERSSWICHESAHPVPDQNSLESGRLLVEFVESLPKGARVLALVSGGASALIEHLNPGLGLDHLQQLNRWLLGNGIDIGRMNQLRSRLSQVKRGGLLKFFDEAEIDCWMISDVPGDAPVSIGSGLFVAAENPVQIDDLPEQFQPWFGPATAPEHNCQVRLEIIASNYLACAEAASQAQKLKLVPHLYHSLYEGDVQQVALQMFESLQGLNSGEVFIAGGEPTLCLPQQPGQGGRNQHLALLLAKLIAGAGPLQILVAGSDGGDGPTPYAGAVVDAQSLEKLEQAGFNADDVLQRCDSSTALSAISATLETGPSGTNVMDLLIAWRP